MFSADVLFVPVKVFAPTHTTAPAPFLPWPRRYLGHGHLDLETELTIQINVKRGGLQIICFAGHFNFNNFNNLTN